MMRVLRYSLLLNVFLCEMRTIKCENDVCDFGWWATVEHVMPPGMHLSGRLPSLHPFYLCLPPALSVTSKYLWIGEMREKESNALDFGVNSTCC